MIKSRDVVRPILFGGGDLVCGSGRYSRAVVLSTQPFVMVSEQGDMKWTQQKIDNFEVVPNIGPVSWFKFLRLAIKRWRR